MASTSTITVTKSKKRPAKDDEELVPGVSGAAAAKKDKAPAPEPTKKKKKVTIDKAPAEKTAPPKVKKSKPSSAPPPPPPKDPESAEEEEEESGEEEEDDEEKIEEVEESSSGEEDEEDDEDEEDKEKDDGGEPYATLTTPEPAKKSVNSGNVHASITEPTAANVKVKETFDYITFSCLGLNHSLVSVSMNRIFLKVYKGKSKTSFRLNIQFQSSKQKSVKVLFCDSKFVPIQSMKLKSHSPMGNLTPFKMSTSSLVPCSLAETPGANIDRSLFDVFMIWCFAVRHPPKVKTFVWPGPQPTGWWSVIREGKLLVETGVPGDLLTQAEEGDVVHEVKKLNCDCEPFFV